MNGGWQQTLIDEESAFLRGVNEGYRTWCLKNQKIQLLQNLLDNFNRQEQTSRLEMRVQQLKAMTLGQLDPTDKICADVMTCENAISKLATLPSCCIGPSIPPQQIALNEAGSDPHAESQTTNNDEPEELRLYKEQMHYLDDQIDEVLDSKYCAECELKDFEAAILVQWQEKKLASEYWMRRHSALTGMRSAMRAALQRYEFKASAENSTVSRGSLSIDAAADEKAADLLGSGKDAADELDEDEDGIQDSWPGFEPLPDTFHALSDVLAEGVTDPKDREEILKREHAGSAEHPHGCRPCHFQGGLCWKGLACSFCHICPKPKRKSKHQRDVDKRRQERYKQVKDDLGIPCLDELTKIDDARRLIMTSSEELKKRVKDAYASRSDTDIIEARQMVATMRSTVDSYHSMMPFLLIPTENEDTALPDPSGGDAEEEDGSDAEDFPHMRDDIGDKELNKPSMPFVSQEYGGTDLALGHGVGNEAFAEEHQFAPDGSVTGMSQTHGKSGSLGKAKGTTPKPTRRGGMNLRGKNKGKFGGDGPKGDAPKGPSYDVHGYGWAQYSPAWEKGAYAWSKKGPPMGVKGPPLGVYWHGHGPPPEPFAPPMYPDWMDFGWNNEAVVPATVHAGGSGSHEAHVGWGPAPPNLQ